MGVILLFFFHKNFHLNINCNVKDKYLGHLLLKMTNVPAVFHSSSTLLDNQIQMSEGSWECTKQCLGSAAFSLTCSHTTPSAVGPRGAFPMDCYLGHVLPKAERAVDSKPRRDPASDASLTTSPSYRHILYLPNFRGALLPTSCSVQYQRCHERSENVPKSCGSEEFRESQMEEEFLWFIMDCWADKSVQEIRRGRSLNPLSAFWHWAYFKVDKKLSFCQQLPHPTQSSHMPPCSLHLGIGNNCCYGEVKGGVNHLELIP